MPDTVKELLEQEEPSGSIFGEMDEPVTDEEIQEMLYSGEAKMQDADDAGSDILCGVEPQTPIYQERDTVVRKLLGSKFGWVMSEEDFQTESVDLYAGCMAKFILPHAELYTLVGDIDNEMVCVVMFEAGEWTVIKGL